LQDEDKANIPNNIKPQFAGNSRRKPEEDIQDEGKMNNWFEKSTASATQPLQIYQQFPSFGLHQASEPN
jgi:hypothetical protein